MLPVAVPRCCSDENAICYILLVQIFIKSHCGGPGIVQGGLLLRADNFVTVSEKKVCDMSQHIFARSCYVVARLCRRTQRQQNATGGEVCYLRLPVSQTSPCTHASDVLLVHVSRPDDDHDVDGDHAGHRAEDRQHPAGK